MICPECGRDCIYDAYTDSYRCSDDYCGWGEDFYDDDYSYDDEEWDDE